MIVPSPILFGQLAHVQKRVRLGEAGVVSLEGFQGVTEQTTGGIMRAVGLTPRPVDWSDFFLILVASQVGDCVDL